MDPAAASTEHDLLTGNGRGIIPLEDYGATSGGSKRKDADRVHILSDQDQVSRLACNYNKFFKVPTIVSPISIILSCFNFKCSFFIKG
jgi:hypothetical protein